MTTRYRTPAARYPAAYRRVREAWRDGWREFYDVRGARITTFIAIYFGRRGYLYVNRHQRIGVQYVYHTPAAAMRAFSRRKRKANL